MATIVAPPSVARSQARYESGIWSWLTTVDHKRIGTLYLYTVARSGSSSAGSRR